MSTSTTALSTKVLYTVGIGVGVTVLTGASYYVYSQWKNNLMPKKWRRVGVLESINIFPVKSCAPLKLSADDELSCEVLGLRLDSVRDRGFMLVDDNNKMVTARVYPKMVLIQTKLVSSTKIQFSAKSMEEELELDFTKLAQQTTGDIQTAVWGVDLGAMLCGEIYDKWFSKCILNEDKGLHLVYYPYPKPVRAVNPRMLKEPYITRQDTGTFNDATSYMLMNLSSVDDLNARIGRPLVHPLQFRGNFHLKMDTAEPYAEDKWNWVKIGNETVFRVVSPCTRCIFPNINVFSGERDPDNEPNKTLNSYRRWKGYGPSPVLGIHLGIRQLGNVKTNDVIYVEDK